MEPFAGRVQGGIHKSAQPRLPAVQADAVLIAGGGAFIPELGRQRAAQQLPELFPGHGLDVPLPVVGQGGFPLPGLFFAFNDIRLSQAYIS